MGIGNLRGFGAARIDDRQANAVARRRRNTAPVKPKPAINSAQFAGSGIAVIVSVPVPGVEENGVVTNVPNLKTHAFSVPVNSKLPSASITTLGSKRSDPPPDPPSKKAKLYNVIAGAAMAGRIIR